MNMYKQKGLTRKFNEIKDVYKGYGPNLCLMTNKGLR